MTQKKAQVNGMNELVEKAVGSKIKSDAEMISRAFNNLTKKYSFLFNGDVMQTQRMLIAAVITNEEQLVVTPEVGGDEEEIYFKMDAIVKLIPEEIKVEIYNKVMDQFVSNLTVEELSEKKG